MTDDSGAARQRTLVDIRYPFDKRFADRDKMIDARMTALHYKLTDSGAGFGSRDLTFASTPEAEHFDGDVRFWQELGADLADKLGEPALEVETRLEHDY
jgi:hypothetical protein